MYKRQVYACEHLHTRLLLVLGHTHCGAIKAALDGEAGPMAAITERIAAALGDVRDPYEASVANARAAAAELAASPELSRLVVEHDLDTVSYTHLDVYKRQGSCRSSQATARCAAARTPLPCRDTASS